MTLYPQICLPSRSNCSGLPCGVMAESAANAIFTPHTDTITAVFQTAERLDDDIEISSIWLVKSKVGSFNNELSAARESSCLTLRRYRQVFLSVGRRCHAGLRAATSTGCNARLKWLRSHRCAAQSLKE